MAGQGKALLKPNPLPGVGGGFLLERLSRSQGPKRSSSVQLQAHKEELTPTSGGAPWCNCALWVAWAHTSFPFSNAITAAPKQKEVYGWKSSRINVWDQAAGQDFELLLNSSHPPKLTSLGVRKFCLINPSCLCHKQNQSKARLSPA